MVKTGLIKSNFEFSTLVLNGILLAKLVYLYPSLSNIVGRVWLYTHANKNAIRLG